MFLTADAAGEPVLVVRGEDHILRGFFNVCRHKAAAVVTAPAGRVSKLRCDYHGWTYDLAGKLRGTPEFDGVCDFAKADNGLVPLGVGEWRPFVWVHAGTPTQTLEAYLAPMPATSVDVSGLMWHARRVYDVACNWKVYVDNYLDGGYHVNTVHPSLAGVLDYSGYTTTTHGNTSLQRSPLVAAAGAAGQTRTGTHAEYWWTFPNAMLNIYDGVMDTNLVMPNGPAACTVAFDFYFAPGTSPEFIANSLAVADAVQAEDADVCRRVQTGLASKSYTAGRFSVRRENAGYYFHQLLAGKLRAAAG